MANNKKNRKIEKASIKFLKQKPALHKTYQSLCSRMARLIADSGAAEVAVGLKNGVYYEHTIN